MADAQTPHQFQRTESRTYTVQEEPKTGLFSNILAIVGFIILIVVVIWGLVNLAGISRGWFSSLFGKNSGIVVTAPKSATSGTPFSISWKYSEPGAGTYAFLYQCQSGFQLQTPSPGGTMNGIPCGAAFTLASGKKEVSLTPFLSRNESLDVPLTIIFMPSATGTSPSAGNSGGTQQAQGSATVTIKPAEAAASPAPAPSPAPTPAAPTPAPTPAYVPPAATQVSKAPADLSVRITSLSSDAYGHGVATFDIENVGGSSSGTYYFMAQLPVSGGSPPYAGGYGGTQYTYSSTAQSPLLPGEHILSTLRFSQPISGTVSVSITSSDAHQGNNYASDFLNASYGPLNYTYPLPYSPYGGGGLLEAQYSSAYYPYFPYAGGYGGTQQYEMYPTAYPQHQYPDSAPYYQQYPYSAFYPYAY